MRQEAQPSAFSTEALLGALHDPGVLNAIDVGPSYSEGDSTFSSMGSTSTSNLHQQPPPVHAPKGLRGIFSHEEVHKAYEPMDLDSLDPMSVLLNVYDVGEEDLVQKVNRYSTLNDRVLIGGVYHVGVQIYGREWGYGGTEDPGISGVSSCLPRFNYQHTYKCTIDLGATILNEVEVKSMIMQLQSSLVWEGINYDLLHQNCLHFANVLCRNLGVRRIPHWLDRFGRAAVKLQHISESVSSHVEATKQLTRSISSNVDYARHQAPSAAHAFRAGVERWGQGLFAAAVRAAGDDSPSREGRRRTRTECDVQTDNLRASLRNRGGIRRQSGYQNDDAFSRALLHEEDGSQQQKDIQNVDAFLLIEEPAFYQETAKPTQRVKSHGAFVRPAKSVCGAELEEVLSPPRPPENLSGQDETQRCQEEEAQRLKAKRLEEAEKNQQEHARRLKAKRLRAEEAYEREEEEMEKKRMAEDAENDRQRLEAAHAAMLLLEEEQSQQRKQNNEERHRMAEEAEKEKKRLAIPRYVPPPPRERKMTVD